MIYPAAVFSIFSVIILETSVFLRLRANCAFGSVELSEIDPVHRSRLQVLTRSLLAAIRLQSGLLFMLP